MTEGISGGSTTALAFFCSSTGSGFPSVLRDCTEGLSATEALFGGSAGGSGQTMAKGTAGSDSAALAFPCRSTGGRIPVVPQRVDRLGGCNHTTLRTFELPGPICRTSGISGDPLEVVDTGVRGI